MVPESNFEEQNVNNIFKTVALAKFFIDKLRKQIKGEKLCDTLSRDYF